eukprot:gene12295-12431_t
MAPMDFCYGGKIYLDSERSDVVLLLSHALFPPKSEDHRLRHIASEQGLWEALALCRHRACLPASYINCVDRCHCLTAKASGKQQLRINSSSLPVTMSSPNTSPVKSNVYGLPQQRPYVPIPIMLLEQVLHELVKFIKRTCDSLSSWDMWGAGFSHWPDVMWKRSALQFMMDLQLGMQEGVCPSVTAKLSRELGRLDDVIRSVNDEGSCLDVPRPAGLPPQHWWYWLSGQGAGHVC